MKRIFISLFFIIFTAAASNVMAADLYFGFKGGYSGIDGKATLNIDNGPSHSFNNDYSAFGLGLTFGGSIAKYEALNLRFEVENFSRFGSGEIKNDKYDDKIKVSFNNSILGSLYLDFPVGDRVTPYFGALLGFNIFSYEAKSRIAGGYVTEEGGGVAFQYGLGAGAALKVNDKWSVDLNARYLLSSKYTIDYESKSFNTNFDIELEQPMFDITAGLRYHF